MKTSAGIVTVCGLMLMMSCGKSDPSPAPVRTYRMGFQNSAPRYDDFNLVLQTLALWTTRADAAIITTEVPWDSLYSGVTPQQYVLNNYSGLADYYETKNFTLWVYIDPANGLNRASDADALVAMGKSIADDDVQRRYRRFVVVMDSMLHPDHLGLALETNLLRGLSTQAVYNGVKNAANGAAAEVRAAGSEVTLSISVQADFAWGKIKGNPALNYIGIDQDFSDFPFLQELGVSSYPYFNFDSPSELPVEYYSRLVEGKSMNLFVSEGGWTSASFDDADVAIITSSPSLQADYIRRQGLLLDHAKASAVFQLVYTDIDLTKIPDHVNPVIKYFAYLGFVDTTLHPKPAQDAWDELFARTWNNPVP